MELLILVVLLFLVGTILGAIWKFRVWLLFALVATTACLGSLFVSELPPRQAIFNDVWSFLWFLLNYGVYVGFVVAAGVFGTFLGLRTRK